MCFGGGATMSRVEVARALAQQQGVIRSRTERPVAERVAAVRRFNRFYTRRIGVLNEALFGAYSLAEMRILWELAHNEGISASRLEHELGMDAGYVSRILRDFKDKGLIASRPAAHDGRIRELRLTERGRKALLLVEPTARGKGIGRALVNECIRFAGAAGYRRVMLWTNSVLHAARHLYEEAGFKLVKREKHHSFGHDLVGQNWELSLSENR